MTDTTTADDAPKLVRKILINEPGIYPGLTSREYFAEPCIEPALTNSGIKTLLGKTPADFAYNHPGINPDAPEAASTAAKRMGDVCHQLALGKGRGYSVGTFKTWQSNDAKAFKADAENQGKTPVLTHKFDEAKVMSAIMVEKIVETLSEIGEEQGLVEPDGGWPYETEVIFAWIEDTPAGPVWCRLMADVWCEELWTVLDPKFTPMLYEADLSRQVHNMGWAQQATFYRRGVERLVPDAAGRVTFANLMVSPDAPHVSRAVMIEEAWRHRCEVEIQAAVNLFGDCCYRNEWPGFPAGIETLNAPPWLLTQDVDVHAINRHAAPADGRMARDADEEDEEQTNGA